MYKIIVLYPKPENQKEFDEHYEKIHIPLTKKIPKLKKLTINKSFGAPTGEPAYYLIAELYFESKEDLNEALKSKEMRDAATDAMKISKGKMQVIFAEEKET